MSRVKKGLEAESIGSQFFTAAGGLVNWLLPAFDNRWLFFASDVFLQLGLNLWKNDWRGSIELEEEHFSGTS